jgi:hypothetical protein
MLKKGRALKTLLFVILGWYAFCILLLNPNKGMIGLQSIGQMVFYIEELDLKTEKEIREFLDESTIPDMPMTKFDQYRWKLYHYGWVEGISDHEWIWKMSEKNQYQVALSGSEENWSITFTPLQDYVYLHDFWYRIATLDLYKIECKHSRYNSTTGKVTAIRNKT